MLLPTLALLSGLIPGAHEFHTSSVAVPRIAAPDDVILIPEDLRLVTDRGIVAVHGARIPAGPPARLRCEVRLTFPADAHGLIHEISSQELAWSLKSQDRTLLEGSKPGGLLLITADPTRGQGLASLDLPLPARTMASHLELELLPPPLATKKHASPQPPPLPVSSGEDSKWFRKCKPVDVFDNCNDNPSQEICGPCKKQPAPFDTCPGEGGSTGPGYITEPASCNLGFSTCTRITTVKFAATYTYASKVQKPCDTVTSGFSFSAFLGPFWQAGGSIKREEKSVSTCCTYTCDDGAPLKPVNVESCY